MQWGVGTGAWGLERGDWGLDGLADGGGGVWNTKARRAAKARSAKGTMRSGIRFRDFRASRFRDLSRLRGPGFSGHRHPDPSTPVVGLGELWYAWLDLRGQQASPLTNNKHMGYEARVS